MNWITRTWTHHCAQRRMRRPCATAHWIAAAVIASACADPGDADDDLASSLASTHAAALVEAVKVAPPAGSGVQRELSEASRQKQSASPALPSNLVRVGQADAGVCANCDRVLDTKRLANLGILLPPAPVVANGDFEDGEAGWDLFADAWLDTGRPHTGEVSLVLGAKPAEDGDTGGYGARGSARQPIHLPAASDLADLTFWLCVQAPADDVRSAADRLSVDLLDTHGAVLKNLAVFSNLDGRPQCEHALRGPFDLRAYRDQTVQVHFSLEAHLVSKPTRFFIDGVEVARTAAERDVP